MSDVDNSFTGTCPTCGQRSHYRVRPTTNPNAIFNWVDDGRRYQRGFSIGSSDMEGGHLRDMGGWPYSIYKRGMQPGVPDAVLCNGIQAFEDARVLLEIIENTDRRPVGWNMDRGAPEVSQEHTLPPLTEEQKAADEKDRRDNAIPPLHIFK